MTQVQTDIQKTISARAWAELLLLALVWGGVFLAVRLALNEVGVWTTIAHRTFWAALVLWGVVIAMRLPVPRSLRIWGAFGVMGALNNLIPFFLLNWAQLHIESGLTSILNGGTAIFGVVVAAIVLTDERLTWRKMLGVTIGFGGVAVAIGIENLLTFDMRSTAQLAAVGATLSYALAGVWARKTLAGLPPQIAAAGMLTASALIAVPLARFIDGPFATDLSWVTWGALAYYALAATVVAYLLYYRVLAMAGAGNLMLVTLLIPPIAIGLGAFVLGETLAPRAFVGLAILAVGLTVLDGRAEAQIRNHSRRAKR